MSPKVLPRTNQSTHARIALLLNFFTSKLSCDNALRCTLVPREIGENCGSGCQYQFERCGTVLSCCRIRLRGKTTFRRRWILPLMEGIINPFLFIPYLFNFLGIMFFQVLLTVIHSKWFICQTVSERLKARRRCNWVISAVFRLALSL